MMISSELITKLLSGSRIFRIKSFSVHESSSGGMWMFRVVDLSSEMCTESTKTDENFQKFVLNI